MNGGGGGGWRNFYRDTAAVVVVVEQGRFGAIRDQSINSIKPEWEHWSNNNDCGGLGTWWRSCSGSVAGGGGQLLLLFVGWDGSFCVSQYFDFMS